MAAKAPGSRLVAVFYADVVAYSRHTSEDEAGTHQALISCLSELSTDVERYGGTLVHFAGDAVLAYFSTATAALSCAIAFQQRHLRRASTMANGIDLEFRIGINLGDVFFEEDGLRRGLYGNGVNVAARLQTLAEPGGICISDAVRLAIGTGVLVDCKFIGRQRVKNIPEPVRAYKIELREDTTPSSPPSRQDTSIELSPPDFASAEASGPHPEHVSVSRMPVTGGLLVGRRRYLDELDQAWSDSGVNIVTVVAWGGAGKSTLTNHWLRLMERDNYRGASRVYTWSFYHQGTVDQMTAADEFIASSLAWFGDVDPKQGTTREKGERLARLVQARKTLLVLDGLEPLQRPPGAAEGQILDQGLHTLLCELAAVNPGLCIVTTRFPVSDLADFHGAHRRIDLEPLDAASGADLLRAHKVKGTDSDLERASQEFGGHCLALTLLANYLNDAFAGDVACRDRVDTLQEDARLGGHAKRILKSYSAWIESPVEQEVLRLIGLFDRPADAGAVEALRTAQIGGLTEQISSRDDSDFTRVVSRLRRVGLLLPRDAAFPHSLDAHPLVRQFFRELLQRDHPGAWRMGNLCLSAYYRACGPEHPVELAVQSIPLTWQTWNHCSSQWRSDARLASTALSSAMSICHGSCEAMSCSRLMCSERVARCYRCCPIFSRASHGAPLSPPVLIRKAWRPGNS